MCHEYSYKQVVTEPGCGLKHPPWFADLAHKDFCHSSETQQFHARVAWPTLRASDRSENGGQWGWGNATGKTSAVTLLTTPTHPSPSVKVNSPSLFGECEAAVLGIDCTAASPMHSTVYTTLLLHVLYHYFADSALKFLCEKGLLHWIQIKLF